MKPSIDVNTQKRKETEKTGGKDGKAFKTLMKTEVYSKTMEIQRNRFYVRLVNNYLKWKSRPSYIAQNLFVNNLITTHKIETTLTVNKPA